MPYIRIKSLRANETQKAWEDVNDTDISAKLEFDRVVIIEKGMESGKTSLCFLLKDENGLQYVAETSAEILKSIYAALINYEKTWEENPCVG